MLSFYEGSYVFSLIENFGKFAAARPPTSTEFPKRAEPQLIKNFVQVAHSESKNLLDEPLKKLIGSDCTLARWWDIRTGSLNYGKWQAETCHM